MNSVIGAASGDVDNQPTNIARIAELPWSAPVSPSAVVFLKYNVPSKLLKGQIEWYKTILSGTTDDQLEVPAVLFSYGTASSTHTYFVEADFEFKGFIQANVNPMRKDPANAVLPPPVVHVDDQPPLERAADTISEAKSEVVWVRRR